MKHAVLALVPAPSSKKRWAANHRAWRPLAATYRITERCPGMPSSVILRYDYDPAQRRLDIAFVSGQAYSYFHVPEAVFQGLVQARSRGRYFQDHIRDKFDFRRDRTGRLYREMSGEGP